MHTHALTRTHTHTRTHKHTHTHTNTHKHTHSWAVRGAFCICNTPVFFLTTTHPRLLQPTLSPATHLLHTCNTPFFPATHPHLLQQSCNTPSFPPTHQLHPHHMQYTRISCNTFSPPATHANAAEGRCNVSRTETSLCTYTYTTVYIHLMTVFFFSPPFFLGW